MKIRVDKCVTFGMRKQLTKSLQSQPKLFINSELFPPVKADDSIRYLGRHFDFSMSTAVHKSELLEILGSLMSEIDMLPYTLRTNYFSIKDMFSQNFLGI